MGVPEADDHRRSLPGDTTGGPSQDTELGHGTRQQPLLDQGASHGSPGPALKQRQLGRNSRNLKGNYLCKTPVRSVVVHIDQGDCTEEVSEVRFERVRVVGDSLRVVQLFGTGLTL